MSGHATFPAGHPIWMELATTDQNAAQQFYAGLLGWNAMASPMPGGGEYTMFGLNRQLTGAAYTLTSEMAGVPPHWLTYFKTDDADATAARAAELGGTLVMGPFDVMDFGRMAVLKDPCGATFAVWQPGTHHGVQVFGEPGSVCWTELATRDAAQAMAFYAALFGWRERASANAPGVDYRELMLGDLAFGGILPMDEQWGTTPPHWAIYFRVDDCDAAAQKATALGGRVVFGPFNAPGVGRLASVADPQGAMFYIIALDPQ